MSQVEINFCEEYAGVFLIIINYTPDTGNRIEEIENFREENLYIIEKNLKNNKDFNNEKSKINLAYDKQISNIIHNSIASANPTLFREVLIKLNKLLKSNRDFAVRLKMIMPNDNSILNIMDYYQNYKIAIKRLADIEFMSKINK